MSPRNGSYDVTYEKVPLMDRMRDKADDFRQYLATTCCACLASVPSFALVVLAVVLVMLLIASIPMAFAFSYMGNTASPSELSTTSSVRVFRDHDIWTDAAQKLPESIAHSSSLLPPNISMCKGFGFACTSEPSHIIGTYQRCDGVPDCADGSDEMDCQSCQTTLACTDDNDNARRICLRGNALCDGVQKCSNGADEKVYCQKQCPEGQRKCKDADICLTENMLCDGDNHCPDGEDERDCTFCRNGAKLCKPQGVCIPKWKLCDGKKDCTDNSDEEGCDCKTCSGADRVLCKGESKMCLLKSKICDGVVDCPGGDDEDGCPGDCDIGNSTTSDASKIVCSDGKDYDWRYGCGGMVRTCDGHCSTCNPATAFDCKLNGTNGLTKCVHRSNVCNGIDDCGNNADEENCDCNVKDMKKCSTPSLSGKPKCFSESQKCDGFNDCADGEDERNCEKCSNGGFLCVKEKKCISDIKRCDGIDDCSDGSDELGCSCKECKSHPFGMYMCSSGDRCFRLNAVCNPYTQCPLGADRDKLFCAVRRGGGQAYL